MRPSLWCPYKRRVTILPNKNIETKSDRKNSVMIRNTWKSVCFKMFTFSSTDKCFKYFFEPITASWPSFLYAILSMCMQSFLILQQPENLVLYFVIHFFLYLNSLLLYAKCFRMNYKSYFVSLDYLNKCEKISASTRD